ncbi:MAG TPA: SPFH domain-containing protein [Verrucomicrobiae bacterium]|jgi:regulator of protease activity HflC (stomatin/prohibitin superfamily)
MDQNSKKIGAINCIALLAATIALLLLTRFASVEAGAMGTVLTGFGLLVALVSYFHMGLLEREQFERMEIEELSKSRGSESLFATAGSDTFPAKKSREQFERFFAPVFTALLFLLQASAAYWPWQRLGLMGPMIADRATLAMALLGLMGLILFMLGKYSSGLARLKGQKLLRPGASYLLLSAYVCFAVTATIAAMLAGFFKTDLIVARVLCVVSGLAAIETLLGLILEVYRVRLRGGESRLLYESRLVGLLGQPEAIITTAAHAMDYQFGFKVSETWFYRFLEKALGWMILAQFAALVLSSCFTIVNAGDEALLERFGKPVGGNGVIGPGLHFKLPWPIDQTRVYHTERIQSFIVGAEPEQGMTIAWAVNHAKETNYLVASRGLLPESVSSESSEGKSPPVNLLSVSIPVQYQITNLTVWAYTNVDPEALLQGVAGRSVTHYLASADFDSLMAQGRAAARVTLQNDMQAQADALQLGARILFVGLEDIHPPSGEKGAVAKSFEEVVGAQETRHAKKLDAEAAAISTNAWAAGESYSRITKAEADQHTAITNSAARAMLFASQQMAYNAAPGRGGIYEQHAYLELLVDKSTGSRKYIVAATNAPSIAIFNLEDKIRKDLIDSLPDPSAK